MGKEANEIEQIDAGMMETEAERLLVYDDGEWEAIQRVFKMVPTKDLQRMTGYSRSMVKYVKSGERRPRFDDRPRIVSIAATYARERLVPLGYGVPANEWEAISCYGTYLRRLEAQDEQARDSRTAHRERKHDLIAAVRAITNSKGIAPTRDIVAEWSVHVPSTLRRRSGVPADDVAWSLASDYPHFGVLDEASLFDELWER